MKIAEGFFLNPENNTNKYTDYINYIDTSSVTSGKLENVQYLDSDFPSRANRLIMKNDILYSSVRPNLKHYYFYKDEYPHCVGSTGFIILRKKGNSKKINEKFVYYYLSTNTICKHFSNIAELSQTTFPSISAKDIAKIDIPNFTFDQQQKIANILSRYDEAIENNSKRIKLLEQMAQNLYKEWFVRFRFPGWQNVEFENGMPKGWCYKKLFDVVNVTYGYAFASELFCDDETLNPVVRIRDILDNQTNTFTSEICADKYIIKENEILIGMDGIFHMCMWNGEKAYQNQRVVKITSKTNEISNYFLFLAVQPQVKFLEQTIAGTTVAHLGDKHLKRMSILLPSESVLKDATKIFDSLMKQKNQLFKANMNLAKQRDLLLPRLMSGKLEV